MSESAGRPFPTARNLRVEELISRYDGIREEVDALLAEDVISSELPRPGSPQGMANLLEWADNGDPICPDDLTELDEVSLGKLFSYISNWTNYVEAKASKARSLLAIEKRKLKLVEAALNLYYKNELNVPANHVKDKVLTDDRFVTVDVYVHSIEDYYQTANGAADRYRHSCHLISREQTRRANELRRQIHEGGEPAPDRTTDLPFQR